MEPPAPGPDAGLQPADDGLLVDHGADRRGGACARAARAVGTVAARPGRSRRRHRDRRAGRLLPVPGSALEELLYRRRGGHLPPAAAARPGGCHARGRRRRAGRLMADLQALDEPDHQPRHGEHRHVRRRRRAAGRHELSPIAGLAQRRRAAAGDDGLGAGLFPDQHGADHGRAVSQAQRVADCRPRCSATSAGSASASSAARPSPACCSSPTSRRESSC